MFSAANLLFLFAESSLHAGIGRGVSGIDLPIQRERTTQYPMVQASGLKGCLRAEASRRAEAQHDGNFTQEDVKVLFGPEQGGESQANASEYAGALAFGDARLLLFPVRSLSGVIAWTTSLDVLARFQRDAALANIALGWEIPDESEQEGEAWTWVHPAGNTISADNTVVLEEFSFTSKGHTLVKDVADWITTNALSQSTEYQYWRTQLPKKLCILPTNAFRDFVRFATEIQTHIKLNPETKTVDSGALWTTESLPLDSLLYAPVLASPGRKSFPNDATEKANRYREGHQVLSLLTDLDIKRVQLGGDASTGQGIMAVRFSGGPK